MPILDATEYVPGWMHKNGHASTMIPYFFRSKFSLDFQRKRIFTPDNDFLDLDFIEQGSGKLAVLNHGLEGSSKSRYIYSTAKLLSDQGWDVLAWNFRGCSGEMNSQIKMYHSGATEDLHVVLDSVRKDYDDIVIIGFSLGGNLALKYAGEFKFEIPKNLKAIATISVPCDLSACGISLAKRENFLYIKRFLWSLRKKVRLKAEKFPNQIKLDGLNKIKTLKEFDNRYTAPIHGFKDAEDYYAKCSSLQFLSSVQIPVLIINAVDDPFLHPYAFPYKIAEQSEHIHLLAPIYGGHVGFKGVPGRHSWAENRSLEFVKLYTK